MYNVQFAIHVRFTCVFFFSAEEISLQIICERAGIQNGQSVLVSINDL